MYILILGHNAAKLKQMALNPTVLIICDEDITFTRKNIYIITTLTLIINHIIIRLVLTYLVRVKSFSQIPQSLLLPAKSGSFIFSGPLSLCVCPCL